MDLPVLSAGFVALAVTLYVMLDGFDLGVGALLLFQQDESLRDQMVDSIVPTWDGNETWLVMAGVALFAAFPAAYSILIPAFYFPIIIMLLGLGLRGVSFEFRNQVVGTSRRIWDLAFGLGSILAALMQGLIVGGLIKGITVTDNQFTGNVFDVFNLFGLGTGATVLTGYMVLGGAWLHLKARTQLRSFAERILIRTTPLFISLTLLASFCSTLVQPDIESVLMANTFFFIAALASFFLVSILLMSAIGKSFDALPFVLTLFLFGLVIAGCVRLFYPYIIPFRLTLWTVASSSPSQIFVLLGGIIVIPVVLAYSIFAYRIFRGKTPKDGWLQ